LLAAVIRRNELKERRVTTKPEGNLEVCFYFIGFLFFMCINVGPMTEAICAAPALADCPSKRTHG
jgi:hypothetical protein